MSKRWDPMTAAFEPPSDYVPENGGGSSTKKKIWMVLGGGCLLIILAIALLFGAGAFKMVSCCNQFQDVAKRSMAAQNYGYEFASLVGSGNIDDAYSRFSEELKSQMSRQEFASKLDEYEPMLNAAVAPRRMNTQARQTGTDLEDVKEWTQTYQFSGATSTEMLVLTFDVQQFGQDEAASFQVSSVDFDLRPRNLAAEPPAVEVTEFHDELQSGNYEMAYGRLGEPFKNETDVKAFRTFLDDQGDLFKRSSMEVKEVAYNSDQAATVVALVKSASGTNAVVQYELISPMPNLPMWKIITISPMMKTNPEEGADAQDGPGDSVKQEDPESDDEKASDEGASNKGSSDDADKGEGK